MPEFANVEIGTCWWCGSAAGSREHKFKRTDIERGFGPGPYQEGQTLVVHRHERRPSDVTGAKSKAFKFEPTLCALCNNERSQPFDQAYDQFMGYLFDNEANILQSGEVDHGEIFGKEWEAKSLDLARYFVKHICCRLANVADRRAARLDTRLVEFLDGGPYPRCLGLCTLLDMSVVEWWRAMRLFEDEPGDYGAFLFQTGIGGVPAPRPRPIENPEGGMLVDWFGIYWRIAEDEYIPNQISGPITSPVVTDWLLGTENRQIMASIANAVERGEVDPRLDLADLMADFGFDRDRSMIDSNDVCLRPAPSPLGLSRDSYGTKRGPGGRLGDYLRTVANTVARHRGTA